MTRLILSALLASMAFGCATLGELGALVRPPRFEEVPDRPAEIRLLSSAGGGAFGGAGVRLWTKVSNPNPFGFTLATLRGTLFLEDTHAATADFPLGLPLGPGGETTVPIDLSISFSELPQLAGVVRRLVARQPISYRFDGTIGVEAGRLGTPTFGPMTIIRGTTR